MIKTITLPVPPWKGLYLDGVTVPGGMSKANNVFILPDGSAERRLFQRTLDESPACLASRGLKNVYELRKADGTRYLFADVDNSDTTIASFGAELVDEFATWSGGEGSGWTHGGSPLIWTHTTGTTALTSIITATPDFVVVPATQYRIVADVTCTAPSSSGTYWAYTSADSTYKWTNFDGGENIIWTNKWTHSAHSTDATIALTAVSDFTPVAGQSYRISVYVTHTSGTGLSVYIGGTLAGVIASTGQHELIATFVADATALRFVPSSNWVGIIESTTPRDAIAYSRYLSVRKFIDPAGANIPSNLDDDELLSVYGLTGTWYPEAAASLSQSLAVYIGDTLGGVIQASGEYTYDVTATTAVNLTFTPTTSWAGSVNSVSVKVVTFGSTGTKMKVIGGTVTGTTDYETSWGNVVTNLTAGASVWPMWATMQDKAFRVDGTNINYYFSNVSGAHTLGVPAPAEAPVTANTTGGELVAGAYNVCYTYVKKEGDRYTEGNPSPASNITIAGTAITVAVIANTDPDITHIRIYRTLYDRIGNTPMRAIEVLNATQTVTLSLTDDLIGDGDALEYNHDMPKRAMFVLTGGSRLWMLRFPGEVGGDSMLMWSEVGLSEYFPSKNSQTFDPDDGDKGMGMALLKDNLLIFKRHRTYIMNMYSFGKDIISPTIGCVASGSIQSVGVNSAIWLSSEGIMLYDGGEPKNISKNKINSVINFFMANGAEPYIDSCYHSTKRQYHINFLYRTGDVITAQRHFVYALDSDAWTEYVYTSDAGTRYYEINFCLASDSNLNEVILIPYLVTTTDTVSYIYQTDYELPAGTDLATEIMTSTGDETTALDDPMYSFTYEDDVYIVGSDCNFFRITTPYDNTLATKECIWTTNDLITAWGMVDTVSVADGGTGYTVNDLITLETPINGRAITLKVTGVSGGVITSVSLYDNASFSYRGAGYIAGNNYVINHGGTGHSGEITVETIWDDFSIVSPHSYLTTYMIDAIAHPELNLEGYFIKASRQYHIGAGYSAIDGIFYIPYDSNSQPVNEIRLVYSTWEKCNVGSAISLADYAEDDNGTVQLFCYILNYDGFYQEYLDIYRFTDAGSYSQTPTRLYQFPTYDYDTSYELVGAIYNSKILDDNLYFVYNRFGDPYESGVTSAWYLGKLTNIFSENYEYVLELYNTGLPNYTDPLNVYPYTFYYYSSSYVFLPVSNSVFYIGLDDNTATPLHIFKITFEEDDIVEIGSELITNGSFTGGTTGWVLGNDIIYGSNNVICNYNGGDDGEPSLSTTFPTVSGTTYILTFTISNANAPVYFYFDNNNQDYPYQNGPFSDGVVTVIFQTDYTGIETIHFDDANYDNGDTWTLDNVSIKARTLPILASELKVELDYSWDQLNILQQDSITGDFFIGGIILYTYANIIKRYDSNWIEKDSYSIPVDSHAGGYSWLSTYATDGMIIACGYSTDNVWKVYPDGYWTILTNSITASDTAPTMSGCIVDIVSNYEDLGMSNDKRVKRMYLDIESQYQTCGYATIEPDYGVNRYVHADAEITEPAGATSLQPFAHPGRQTWEYTNDQFDSSVEAWLDIRLDIGTQGKKFRYSIRVGDIPSANHGILRIRPPRVDVQVKNKY